MSQQLFPPEPVKLIVGILGKDEKLFAAIVSGMRAIWGSIDVQSEIFPFDCTDYYTKQMGGPLLRKFVSFSDLILPGYMATIKHQSNALEAQYTAESAAKSLGVERIVNLDPGYVDPAKLVLATTKNYSHRIYIGQAMYAEATLHWHQGKWCAWPYTYKDYGGGTYDGFLSEVRQILMEQLKSRSRNT